MKKIADTFWRVSDSKELETLNKSLKELHTTCLHHNFHISKCVCGWKHVLNLTVSFLQFVIVSLHCIYHCIYHYIVSLVSMWVFFFFFFIVYEILFISYVCETQRFREKRNININYYYYVVPRNISSRSSRNSGANASENLESLKKCFPVTGIGIGSWTNWCMYIVTLIVSNDSTL